MRNQFPFPITPLAWVFNHSTKTPAAVTQTEIKLKWICCTVAPPQGRKRTSGSDYEGFKSQAEGTCRSYLQFVERWCKTRKRCFFVCFLSRVLGGICCRQKHKKQLNSGWTPAELSGAPVFCECQQASSAQTLLSPPSPPATQILSRRDFHFSYHSSMNPLLWIIPILCSNGWVLAGPRLLTQMGVHACDGFHMSHRSRESERFFKKSVFFPSLISFSVSLFKTRRDMNVTEGGEGQMWRLVIYFISRWAFRPRFRCLEKRFWTVSLLPVPDNSLNNHSSLKPHQYLLINVLMHLSNLVEK